ncbi:hypothetical protein PLICRDRAFT_180056 [Plicaturopsis crispa FD-325 SS-3]|uniref:NAD(P)-binding protein n=1 Tax=Plicaturopsis crispa FD-325 SS-3 TaxID=944288 RepID=A0A0C9T375_PLICR|nr:hypothetical protein PLICRDRAFT_180056 [Plicaturopsis crispa FD-325 SS-3]
MKYTVKEILSETFSKWPAVVHADLTGKTVMLIGASTGIGLEASIHFANMKPARIIMACRSLEKGNAAIAKLEKQTGYTNAELWLVDLSKYSSVLAFADKFEKDGGRLDIVVYNAGVLPLKYTASPEGWEMTLQVNVISAALISLLLLPVMERTAKTHSTTPRLVIVSSGSHYFAEVPDVALQSPKILEKLNDEKYNTSSVMRDRYPLSKLLVVLFTRALSDHLGASFPVVAVDPGYCHSELRREIGFPLSALNKLIEYICCHPAEEGSRQLVYAAVGGSDAEMHAAYIALSKVKEVSDFALGEKGVEAQKRVWDELIEILSKVSPKIPSIVNQWGPAGSTS